MFAFEKSFKQVWRELSKNGWSYKRLTGLSNDHRYIPPGGNVKGVEEKDYFVALSTSRLARSAFISSSSLNHCDEHFFICNNYCGNARDHTPHCTNYDSCVDNTGSNAFFVYDHCWHRWAGGGADDSYYRHFCGSKPAAAKPTTTKRKAAPTTFRRTTKRKKRSEPTVLKVPGSVRESPEQSVPDLVEDITDGPDQPVPDILVADTRVPLDDFDSDHLARLSF
ncbi:hypothetical protein PHMEG_00033142 [Phytophthora megakarya]|uniref:Uncharacterized protein n=1 Tax=Phytophthora megakarya TaxID=4795 RepID=A0A225UTJ5_9STRA|nr:hypothetical protein PHMEG_00033142 [Phytophthora megakarya]